MVLHASAKRLVPVLAVAALLSAVHPTRAAPSTHDDGSEVPPVIEQYSGTGNAWISIRVEGEGFMRFDFYGLGASGPGYVSASRLHSDGSSIPGGTSHVQLGGPWAGAYATATVPGLPPVQVAQQFEYSAGSGVFAVTGEPLTGEPLYLVGVAAGHFSRWRADVRGDGTVRVAAVKFGDSEPLFATSKDMNDNTTLNVNAEVSLVGARASVSTSLDHETSTHLFGRFVVGGGAPWIIDGIHSLSVTYPNGTTETIMCAYPQCYRPDFLFDDLGGPDAAPPGRYRFTVNGAGVRVIFGEIAMLIVAQVTLPGP